jgi:hypothetical protein
MSETTASTRFSPITTSVYGKGEIVLDALDERGDVGRFDGKTHRAMWPRDRR